MKINKEILENGIILYSFKIPEVKTISISIAVKIGSVYENKNQRGISHFLEHMMFKSNKKYSAYQISTGLELCGGISNASTSTFLTFYYSETIPSGFPKVLDIFYSMFENEKYDEKEFESEKKVVMSEIERLENNPESLLLEKLVPLSVFGKSDYGEPIIGYRETIETISKEELEEFKKRYYTSNNIFILVEGNFKEKHLDMIRKKFSKLDEGEIKKKKTTKLKGENIEKKANTQNQIYIAKSFEVDLKKENFYIPFAFSEIISGGVSSLLFNVFRVKYGIGYRLFFEPSFIYEDKIILTLAIPGYEREKDKYIENAYNDLINEIKNEKNFDKYFEGRKKLIRLKKLEKLRFNLIKRITYDTFLIALKEEILENFYFNILRTSKNEIINFVDNLKNERIAKIIPY